MHSLTRIRATAYSIMLVFAGVLAMPHPAYAQGDAAGGEKIFAHCAPCHSAVHVRCCAGFRTPAVTRPRHARAAGV